MLRPNPRGPWALGPNSTVGIPASQSSSCRKLLQMLGTLQPVLLQPAPRPSHPVSIDANGSLLPRGQAFPGWVEVVDLSRPRPPWRPSPSLTLTRSGMAPPARCRIPGVLWALGPNSTVGIPASQSRASSLLQMLGPSAHPTAAGSSPVTFR